MSKSEMSPYPTLLAKKGTVLSYTLLNLSYSQYATFSSHHASVININLASLNLNSQPSIPINPLNVAFNCKNIGLQQQPYSTTLANYKKTFPESLEYNLRLVKALQVKPRWRKYALFPQEHVKSRGKAKAFQKGKCYYTSCFYTSHLKLMLAKAHAF
jgi:hypothetical protein